MAHRTKKYRMPLAEDEFYSMIQKGLQKDDFSITGDIIIVKEVSQEEMCREAEKPLYLTRYE
jgi:hypothetical protein